MTSHDQTVRSKTTADQVRSSTSTGIVLVLAIVVLAGLLVYAGERRFGTDFVPGIDWLVSP